MRHDPAAGEVEQSVVPVRRYVSGACRPVWPEETTGIALSPLRTSASRHASIERTTESSSSQNLLAMPLTWI